MKCHFCNTKFDTDPEAKEIFISYSCPGCLPHIVVYRELYDDETRELLSDAISIDDYDIIRIYDQDRTMFDKNTITFYEVKGIWQLPSTNIDVVLSKLQIYTTFI